MTFNSLGFIGLGEIGLPMAENLLKANFNLKVFNRTQKQENNERLKGAIFCDTPRQASLDIDALIICVSDENAVKEVLFGPNGACESLPSKTYVIDCTTISPDAARSFATSLRQMNINYLDAPVSGGTEGAKSGDLTIFLGCNNETLIEIKPILDPISSSAYSYGDVGKGQEVKIINQVLVAGSYFALAEGIALAEKLNLPLDLVVSALKNGAASSWALENRSDNMIRDQYPLGFKLCLHHKDLNIALKTAANSGIILPISSKINQIEAQLIQKGYGDKDISVLKKAIS